jgi:hypothetical protein
MRTQQLQQQYQGEMEAPWYRIFLLLPLDRRCAITRTHSRAFGRDLCVATALKKNLAKKKNKMMMMSTKAAGADEETMVHQVKAMAEREAIAIHQAAKILMLQN